MKKLVCIFFIAVFLFNSMGYFLLFEAERMSIRNDMRSAIENGSRLSSIDIISIPNRSLNNPNGTIRVEDHELIIDGKFYDIIKSVIKKDLTIFYALKDSREEGLFSYLDNHIRDHVNGSTEGKSHSGAKKIMKNILKLYYYESFAPLNYHVSADQIAVPRQFPCTSNFNNQIFLPPKLG